MSRKRLVLKLSDSERDELERIIEDASSSKRLVLRCRIILLTENGIPMKEIADILELSRVTVNTWRQVYLAKGVEGLKVKRKPGRPSKIAREIMSCHFPGLAEEVSLPLKKVLNMKSRVACLLHRIDKICGVLICSILIASPI